MDKFRCKGRLDVKFDDLKKRFPDLSDEIIQEQLDRIREDVIFINSEYQINVSFTKIKNYYLYHLSIKRIDKLPIHDWRDLQVIKNEILGEDAEAVELYPAENRLVDSANQYHLWSYFDENGKPVPCSGLGFKNRLVEDNHDPITNVSQRPFEK